MNRGAKIAGWIAGGAAALAGGAIALALLAVRSPLADGSHAAGPDATAYGIVLGAVAAGAVVFGLLTAGLVAIVARIGRR